MPMSTRTTQAGINLDHNALDPVATDRRDMLLQRPARATATAASYRAPTQNPRRPDQPSLPPGRSRSTAATPLMAPLSLDSFPVT